MADASLTFLLGNLKELLEKHLDLISNAENELKGLKEELEYMNAGLEEASKRHNKNKVFEQWEKKIGDVVDEVEDVIDTCVTQVAAKSSMRRLAGGTKLAQQVRNLRAEKVTSLVAEIKDRLLNPSAVGSNPDTVPAETMDIRKKNPRVDNVVGFEDETDTIITYLSEPSEALEVISIVGMPGLGKTTVAWKIYNDPKIQFEFPTRIWIHVSQTLNKKDLCLTILKKFTQQDFSNKSENELVQLVKDNLDRGKFVIFMDDVWGVQDWDDIKDVLPIKNKLGKVLITSRHEDVACHANPLRLPHKLRFLTDAESWKLLQLEVYGKPDLSPSDTELAQTGQVIASNCGGLPLAIIVIGGILLDKISTARGNSILIRQEWRNVSVDVDAHFFRDDKQKRMEYIISLSYDILPYDLRTCFLYMGMFPENTGIPAWKLIQLWIAEGFIKQKRGKSLEEIAQDNLKDLIGRNLVMVDNTKPGGEVKTCRVHDTIREFCRNEGASKKKLFQEVEWSKEGVFEPPVNELEKYRRISIRSYVHRFLSTKPNIQKARSFLCFSKALIVLGNKDVSLVYEVFSLLRVLDAETIKFPKFPAKITQLVHLRYLTLSFDEQKSLPSVITELLNLETLIVKTTSRTLDVEANIWKMIHLRYLKTKASIILKKDNGKKDEKCKNLHTLSRLSPKSCTDVVFNKASNLNTLGIRGDLSLLLDSKCFGKLERLNKLKLVHDIFPNVASENPLCDLLPPEKFPQNIRILTLSGSYLSWEPYMSLLGKLVLLEVIKLKDNAFVGDSWDACGGGFLRLEHLHIERTDLKYWTAKEDAFPRLKCVVLKNCEKLQGVPAELEGTLDTLSMERVTPFAVFQANKMKAKKQGRFKLIVAPGDQVMDN